MAKESVVDEEETKHLTAAEDADLEDLLSHQEQAPSKIPATNVGLMSVVNAQCSYACYAYPRLCTCFAILAVAMAMVLLVNIVVNPTETFGTIANDYTNIESEYDLTVGKVDHWCLSGDNDSCRCEDPLTPQGRQEFKSWREAHKLNKQRLKGVTEKDVAFLGGSLIEEMDGRWKGRDAASLNNIAKTFRKNFEKGDVQGVALGIAGDTAPNVLWRLLHGEAPPSFKPKIWWLSLGMNELGRMQCSEEIVVIGILRVVEELRKISPDARIVINSLLPMADLRGGVYPMQQDFKDAFKNKINVIPASHFAQNGHIAEKAKMVQSNAGKKTTEAGGNGRHLKKNSDSSSSSSSNVAADGEQMTKKQIKKFNKMVKRDPVNPKINGDRMKIKKYDPKKLFMKKNRLPLWTSITAINRELQKFCQKHPGMQFFDSTSIFAERVQGNQFVLESDFISVRGHPTELGYKRWEEAALVKVKKMLSSIDKEAQEPGPAAEMKEKQETGSPKKKETGGE